MKILNNIKSMSNLIDSWFSGPRPYVVKQMTRAILIRDRRIACRYGIRPDYPCICDGKHIDYNTIGLPEE